MGNEIRTRLANLGRVVAALHKDHCDDGGRNHIRRDEPEIRLFTKAIVSRFRSE